MLYDSKSSLEEAIALQDRSDDILRSFHILVGSDIVSIGSGDDISAVLYGGDVDEVFSVAVGHFKSGARKGEVKFKKEVLVHTFPRLVAPLKGTETAKNKAGNKATWSVKEEVLLSLKTKAKGKEIVACILEYRGLEKLRSTYLQGWSDLIVSKCWEKDMLHGNLNQCVAVTGRLSSTSPNLQNPSKAVKKFLITRY